MLARIRVGASVGQDFQFFKWPADWADVLFKIEPFRHLGVDDPHAWCVCTAKGFGRNPGSGDYGNGSVFASFGDLLIDEAAPPTRGGRTVIVDVA